MREHGPQRGHSPGSMLCAAVAAFVFEVFGLFLASAAAAAAAAAAQVQVVALLRSVSCLLRFPHLPAHNAQCVSGPEENLSVLLAVPSRR